jgi:NitT/TauT family transport system substrate-binding protein
VRRRVTGGLVALASLLVLVLAGCGGSGESAGTAQETATTNESGFAPEQTSVKIGYSAVDIPLLPEQIAVEQGLFEKDGVSVEFIPFDGDGKTAQALQSGAVDLVSAGGPVALATSRTGDLNLMVADLLSEPTDILVAKSDITSAAALKGKNIAVSQFGGDSHASVLLALKDLGLSNKDVTIVQVGGQSDRIAALASGSVAAAPVDQTMKPEMEKQGYSVLVTLADTGLRTPRHGLIVPKKYLDANPETVAAVVAGIMEGMQVMFDDRDTAAQIYADWTQQSLADSKEQLDLGLPLVESQRCLRSEAGWWDQLKEIVTEMDTSLESVDQSAVWTNDVVDDVIQRGVADAVGAPCS